MSAAPLETRFLRRLRALGVAPGAHVLVALSGGADSVVLLHLLRFAAAPLGLRLTAAHLDHAMRPESADDARWVAGLCRAWGVPLRAERAAVPPRGEAGARTARYAFLRRSQRECGAAFLAVAHHADDQVETVLLRLLRGAGTRGLAGIPARGPGGLVRPLLPFPRAALRRHARRHRLRWREDASNRCLAPLRNRVRHRLLPALRAAAGPRLRPSLLRLARLAARLERRLERSAARALAHAARREGRATLLVRDRMRLYDWPVASRALRRVLRRYGVVPGSAGTRAAMQFITGAPSGRTLRLPGGRAVIRTEFGLARVEPLPPPPGADVPARVEGERGLAGVRLGGRGYRVEWRPAAPGAGEGLRVDAARLPLEVRAWRPGDRIRVRAGTQSLRRLWNARRVPAARRASLPVVADHEGRVLWVAGVARAAEPETAGPAILLTISDA